jgi:hypothetical protein
VTRRHVVTFGTVTHRHLGIRHFDVWHVCILHVGIRHGHVAPILGPFGLF